MIPRRRPVPVLYAHSSSLIGGGNKVLLSLFENIDRSRFRPLSAVPDSGPLERHLDDLDVPHFIAGLRPSGRSRIATLSHAAQLAIQCRMRGIQLVHANDIVTYRIASMAAALSGAARVCHIHHPSLDAAALAWSFQRVPRLVLTPTAFMRRQVIGCLPAPSAVRVETAWNPIDADWFRPAEQLTDLRKELGLAPTQHHVNITAALAPHKGHECFLRMAREVLHRLPDTMFHIVGSAQSGDALHAERLRTLSGELGISDRVKFWGFLPDAMVRDLMRASDLFVLPTREEGFGLSVAEAQACEVPVLTSAIEPLNEVVDAGSTGYLIEPEDFGAFAMRAIALLESQDQRVSMGRAGRQWVVSRFSKQACAARVEVFYDQVLSRTTPERAA
ncbi:MAG: glycosyltransferase family 4 protein [Acidobacteriota bacterium]